MEIVNFTEARNNLKSILDRVYENNEEIIIFRKNGQSFVISNLSDYNALKETKYLLSNPHNKERLLSSLKHAKERKTFEKKLISD
ncbi:MAG: type II toxin-antitoxin system prevent-host-death family antitoxin [Deltaproteobacteria bacterium]|jgi:antitoxin YefM|uniref:Antitoxin n=1 Tax=Candidatus Acididesulfobacter diazotrophicus TaxID=2597226 RepID=A0A519BLY3_9DELT|nr:type II toxin-antitoxin system prevent-host-death family antitoxin [Deltaproteobacteria bacterium]RZD18263.1 MAG: type II toxin-antitoxin system prevent-host-death family antitoxin [Candidatus Acididesulfobacter diazotrophicus]